MPKAAADAATADNAVSAQKMQLQAALMMAIFGASYRQASGTALATLPDVDKRSETGAYVVTPVSSSLLPSGQMVLIANAEHADDKGGAIVAHASSGLLNVYLLAQQNGKWQLVKRHDNVAALGSFGLLGDVVWTQLAPGRPGFAVINGGTWQGASVGGLSLFDPAAPSLHELGGAALYSNNDGACEPDSAKCWSVSGKWRLVPAAKAGKYDDLLIDFVGEESSDPSGDGDDNHPAKRVTRKYAVQARYAYDGQTYRLVSGSNPVPGI